MNNEITTVEELDALPVGSVVLDDDNDLMHKVWGKPYGRDDFWAHIGSENPSVALVPARLLHPLPDAPTPSAEDLEEKLRRAEALLWYALHLRMYGECAPGGQETWREFDMRCESFLRGESQESLPDAPAPYAEDREALVQEMAEAIDGVEGVVATPADALELRAQAATDAALAWFAARQPAPLPVENFGAFGQGYNAALRDARQSAEVGEVSPIESHRTNSEDRESLRDDIMEAIEGAIPDDLPGYRQRYTDKAVERVLAVLAARHPAPTVSAEQVSTLASESGRLESTVRDWMRVAGIEVQDRG